jgi:hypothetical protein
MQTSTQVADNDPSTDHLASTTGAFSVGRVVESPSNITSSLNINQNRYTELEYVLTPTANATSSYCLRVSNGGTPLDFYNKVAEMNLQFDPSVGVVNFNNGQNISLIPGTTTRVYASTTLTDFNGAADIVMATTTFYKTPGNANCAPNDNNCYVVDTSNTCSLMCSGNTCDLSCYANFQYFASSTLDDGTDWYAQIEVNDISGGYDFADSIPTELLPLNAISVLSGINYGTLSASSTTGTFNASTSLRNVGNTSVDVGVSGTPLIDTIASSSIAESFQRYATSSFNYDTCTIITCTTLSTSSVNYEVDLNKPINTTPVTDEIYWGIAIPLGVSSLPHFGTNLFTVISD